jgi:hypothetical protein
VLSVLRAWDAAPPRCPEPHYRPDRTQLLPTPMTLADRVSIASSRLLACGDAACRRRRSTAQVQEQHCRSGVG